LGESYFLEAKYFTKNTTVEQFEALRVMHITKIGEGHKRFPYIEQQVDVYNEVVTFRLSRFIDEDKDTENLTPDDREKYDALMEFATAVAFADVSGILSRDEIGKVLKGEEVQLQVRGREIY